MRDEQGAGGAQAPPEPTRTGGTDPPPIEVLVLAGAAPWRDVARRCLETVPGVHVLTEPAERAAAALPGRKCRPAVLVMDRRLWEDRSAWRLRRARARPRILTVTGRADDAFALRVVRGGGHGVMTEAALEAYLPKAVRCLAAGQTWLTRVQEARAVDALWRSARHAARSPAPEVVRPS